MTTLHARLIVADADQALDFYARALGAETIERYCEQATGRVVHAAVRFEDMILSLADSDPSQGNRNPHDLGGSPVILSLTVTDALAFGRQMVEAGAEVLIPIEDRPYGKREGRIRDPLGHLWIVSQPLEVLSPEEIQRRLDGGSAADEAP